MKILKRYALCFLILGSLWSFRASAAPKELTEQELAILAEKVDKADKLFKNGKYEEALPLYQEAYLASEEPTMLFSTAQCFRNLKRYQEAADAYQKFLSNAPQDSEYRPIAEKGLKESQAELQKATPSDEPTPQKKGKAFYMLVGAGAAGVAGAGAGVAAFALSKGAQQDQADENFAGAKQKIVQSFALGVACDVLVASAIGLGVVGYLSSQKEKAGEPSVSVSPSGVTLTVRF